MTSSPYSQNIEIVKGFFRKPMVLLTAIMSFVATAYSLFLSFSGVLNNITISNQYGPSSVVSVNPGVLPGINVTGVVTALAFLLFFILSRKPDSKLSAPSVMFKVISIIELVAVCAAMAALGFFAFTYVSGSYLSDIAPAASVLAITIMAILLIAAGAFIIVLMIAQLRFASSVRKSLTSIYLTRNGAALFGIMMLVLIGFELVLFAFSLPALSSIIEFKVLMLGSSKFLLGFVANLFMAITALMYSSYIKNISSRFVTEPQQQASEEEQTPQPVRNVQEVPIQQYIPNMPAPGEVPPAPTTQAPAPEAPQTIICKNCGEQLGPDDYFCNNCGTPIER